MIAMEQLSFLSSESYSFVSVGGGSPRTVEDDDEQEDEALVW